MQIEIIARAVIIKNDRILLAHFLGASNTFFPGGHVQRGEPLKTALVRELKEELGVEVEIGIYLGAIEHTWSEDIAVHHEINHFFSVEIPELDVARDPESHESHLEFFWAERTEMEKSDLEPAPLRKLLIEQGFITARP